MNFHIIYLTQLGKDTAVKALAGDNGDLTAREKSYLTYIYEHREIGIDQPEDYANCINDCPIRHLIALGYAKTNLIEDTNVLDTKGLGRLWKHKSAKPKSER
jgi:hypothetical protein